MKSKARIPIRVLTKNVRYATRTPFKGEEPWNVRRSFLINELTFNTRHCAEAFMCLQEVLHNQLVDINRGLNAQDGPWDFVGVGRDDGDKAGEYSPIFYQPGIWDLKSWTTLWLSETPDKPSRGWDAASIRILTIARFAHRQTRMPVIVMNTHLDDQGRLSRFKSACMIKAEVRNRSDQGPSRPAVPVFLAGDFNSPPEQEAYRTMTSGDSPVVDLREATDEAQRYGDLCTYTGFNISKTKPERIDFLFLSHGSVQRSLGSTKYDEVANNFECDNEAVKQNLRAVAYGVLPNQFEDGVLNSDHRAVVGDVILESRGKHL